MGDGSLVVFKAGKLELSFSSMKQICYSVWERWPLKGSLLTWYVLAGSHLLFKFNTGKKQKVTTVCACMCLATGRRMTTRSYATLILAAWINAVFWASMPTVGWASYAPDPTGATCTVNWRKNDV